MQTLCAWLLCDMLGECIKALYMFGIDVDFFLECFFHSVGNKIVKTVNSKAFECRFIGGELCFVILA